MSMVSGGRGVVICVSGMTGSGKSTLARRIARRYGLRYASGGEALKELATEKGHHPGRRGWWESEEGLRFIEERKGAMLDREVDRRLLELADQGEVVLDSWTMPWLIRRDALKIWLKVSLEERAQRVVRRDRRSLREIVRAIKEKEEKTRAIYKDLYGFDFGGDLSPFDLVLNTDGFSVHEVCSIVFRVIDLYMRRGGRR